MGPVDAHTPAGWWVLLHTCRPQTQGRRMPKGSSETLPIRVLRSTVEATGTFLTFDGGWCCLWRNRNAPEGYLALDLAGVA